MGKGTLEGRRQDRRFMALAEELGSPSEEDLRSCRALQQRYRKQGKSVRLQRIAKAKGLLTSELKAELRARREAAGAAHTKVESKGAARRKARTGDKARAGDKARTGSRGRVQGSRTRVGSGSGSGARRAPRRSSNAPLYLSLAAAAAVCAGLGAWVATRPARTPALAATTPAPAATPDPVELLGPAPNRVAPAPTPWVRPAPAPSPTPQAITPAPAASPSPVDEESPVAAPVELPQAAPQDASLAPAAPEDGAPPAKADGEPDEAAQPQPSPPDVTVPAGASEGGTTLVAAAKSSLDAQSLLFEVYQRYDDEDAAGLAELLPKLEALGPGLDESHCARGLHDFLTEDFAGTIAELEQVDPLEGYRERDALARAAMFLGRFGLARKFVNQDDPDGARIAQLLDGPFRKRYPLAAPMTEMMTPEGHYRVITDLGLGEGELDALERKLKDTPEDARQALLTRAREKHRGLHEVAAVMDKAYRAYTKLFATQPHAEVVPTVYVFSQEADFHDFSNKLQVGSTENTLGYYVPRYRVLVFYDQEGHGQPRLSDKTLNVLLHETFHQWLHLYVDGAPHWFNEGLAEYFGIAKMTRKTLHYGLVPAYYPSRLDNIRWALTGQVQAPMPLSRLLRADRESFMSSQAAINYAEAWSFVHFMASTRKGRDLLRDYFHALQDGLDLDQAYERVFGAVDMVGLEQAWKDYVFALKKT